jgi:hypothetical protein
MTVAAMGAKDSIFFVQVGADTHGNGLFAHIGVTGAVDQPRGIRFGELLFAAPNFEHFSVEGKELFLIQSRR